MAHDPKNLSVYPTGCTWGDGSDKVLHKADLVTGDAPATVEAANYLNASVTRLPKGTIIDAIMTAGGTPVRKCYVVTANTGTAVTIALQTTTAG